MEQLDRATQRSSANWAEAGEKVGRGLGLLSIASVKLAADQERLAYALERNYGEAADDFQAFADEIQNTTIFSDDQVLQGANVAAQLKRNFDFTDEQIQQVIRSAADLASMYGTDLASAVDRVVAGLRGEAESAEMIGLSLGDASTGVLELGNAVTETEKAQLRFVALQEQSAYAAGAAADVADQSGQAWRGWANTINDGLQSAGAHLADYQGLILAAGAASQVISPLGDVFTALGGKQKLASLGSTVLASSWMGPAGLAVGAVAVGAAVLALMNDTESLSEAQARASGVADMLGGNLADLAERYRDLDLLSPAQEAYAYFEQISAGSVEAEAAVQTANEEMAKFGDLALDNNQATLQWADGEAYLEDVFGESSVTLSQRTLDVLEYQGALSDGIVTTAEMAAAQAFLAGNFEANADTLEAYGKAFADAMGLAADPRFDGSAIIENVNNINAAVESGAFTEEQGLFLLQAMVAERDHYSVAIQENTALIDAETAAVDALNQSYTDYETSRATNRSTVTPEEVAGRARFRILEAEKAALDAAFAARISQEDILAAAAADRHQAEIDAINASAAGGSEIVAWKRESAAADAEAAAHAMEVAEALGLGNQRAQLLAGLTWTVADNLGLAAANAAAGLDNTFRIGVKNLDGINSTVDGVMDWATELVNVEGAYGKIDDLVWSGAMSAEDAAYAQRAYNRMLLDQQDIQQDILEIQADQIPYVEQALDRQRDTLDAIADMEGHSQAAALGWMDAAEAQRFLTVQTELGAAANTELGSTARESMEAYVASIVATDPYMTAMLEKSGLIFQDKNGNYVINWDNADDINSDMDRLISALEALNAYNEITLQIDLNGDGAIGKVEEVREDVRRELEGGGPIEWPVDLKLEGNAGDKAAVEEMLGWGGGGGSDASPSVTVEIDADTGKATSTFGQFLLDTGQAEAVTFVNADTSEASATVYTWIDETGRQQSAVVVDADTGPAIAATDGAVAYADGQSATISIDADASAYWRSIPETGHVIGTNYIDIVERNFGPNDERHAWNGGVIDAYADGGVVARMAEHGPELLHFPRGGVAVAPVDGRYRVPSGTYVSPASASRGYDRGGGAAVLNFHGNIQIYPESLSMDGIARELAEWRG